MLRHSVESKVLTGFGAGLVSAAADTRRGFSLGAAGVLQKPVYRDQLILALNALALPDTATGRQSTKILVVDDDPKNVAPVASELEAAHYRVWRAYGGYEAIELIRQTRPDLANLDLMMPKTNGFDVVREIKNNANTSDIPILILTSKLLTLEDRQLLKGHEMQIVEKTELNAAEFVREVRRALELWARFKASTRGAAS